MTQFIDKVLSDIPFVLFGRVHLTALGIVGLFILSTFFIHRFTNQKQRDVIRYILAGVLLVNQVTRHLQLIYLDQWSIEWNLPLHLCSIFVWLSAWMLFTKSYTIFEFAYFLGIAGALQALLTPDASSDSIQLLYLVQFVIAHGGIITAAVYMAVAERYRPTWASIRKVFIWGNLYLVVVTGINMLIGSNYLYSLHKPHVPTLLDYLGPWPWYLLGVEGIALVMFLLLFIPYLRNPQKKSITGGE